MPVGNFNVRASDATLFASGGDSDTVRIVKFTAESRAIVFTTEVREVVFKS